MHFDYVMPVLYSDQDINYYDALARGLKRRGATVGLIALSREGFDRLSKNHDHVFNLYEGWDRDKSVSPEEIEAIEKKYRISINDHVHPEHTYPWGLPIADLIPRAVHTFRAIEQLLDRHSVSLFVNNMGGEVVRRTLMRMSARGGPPSVTLDAAPLRERMVLTTSDWDWDDLPPRPNLPALSPSERRLAEEMMESMTNKRPSAGRGGIKLRLDFQSLRWSATNIGKAMLGEPLDYSVRGIHRERATYMLRHLTHRSIEYDKPVTGEPYLFFPLHVPHDSAISVRAPQFMRQDALVEYLALRALPATMKLYVKPHPDGVYTYSTRMLARLSKLPNVRLIHPSKNSHELISKSRGVIVINSTVGFEAIFHRKPVVCLSHIYYGGFGVTTDVHDLLELPKAVRSAIDHEPDREQALRFIHAAYSVTSPGRWGITTDENIQLLCDALSAKSARLKARPGGLPVASTQRA